MRKLFSLFFFFFITTGALANNENKVTIKNIPVVEGAYLVEVEVEERAELTFDSVKRFLITNNAVANVISKQPTSLIVEAKKIGSTFLHVWDSSGRKTIKFVVKRKKLPESTVAKREREQAKKKGTFKIAYQFEFVTTDIGPEFNKTANDFKRFHHLVSISGETPYGFLWGYARFQDYDNTSFEESYWEGGIRFSNVRTPIQLPPNPSYGSEPMMIGPHMPVGPFQDFLLIAGENFFNITPLTAPWSLSRGVFWYHTLFDGRLEYNLLWTQDREPFQFVGATEIDTPDHFYSGADVTWHMNEYLDLGGTFFFSYGDRRETVADHVAAGNFFLDFENITFDGEFAQTEDAISYRVGSDFYLGNDYHVGGVWRDIRPDFFAINGQSGDRGEKGFLIQAEADPLDFLHASATLDRFRDRLFPNEADPDGWNTDFLVRGRINLPWRMYLTSTYRDADRTGSLISRQEESVSLQLNKSFSWPRGLGFYARAEKKKVDNFRSSLLSYDRDSIKIGGRWRLIRGLSVGVTQEWAKVDSGGSPVTLTVPNSDFPKTFIYNPIASYLISEETYPRRFTADINYYTQIADTPFYLDLRFRYEDEEHTESINSFFAGEDTVQGEVELSYMPSDSFKAYCRGRLEDRKSEIDGERDLVEAELVVGANMIFDTGLSWEPQGEVEGVVFKDKNGDGKLNIEEQGIAGVELYTGDQRVVTNQKGEFDFGKLRGKSFKIVVDLDTVPTGFINTTPFSQEIVIHEGKTQSLVFGLFARAGLRGVVFNDVNGNGFLDGEDKGLSKVVIQLGDGEKRLTDSEGRYYFENVSPGEYELKLVLDSLPLNHLPKVPVKQKILIAEGRTHARNFPVQVTQKLTGKVFKDNNKNGVCDKEEKGLERVMVALGTNLAITDSEGNFIFKNIPTGRHIVEVRTKSIPEGYALSTPGSCVVTLQTASTTKNEIYFGLKE